MVRILCYMIILAVIAAVSSTYASDTTPSTPAAKTNTSPPVNTAAKTVAKTVAKKPTGLTKTEAEVSAVTTEVSDSFSTRLYFQRQKGLTQAFLRTGYARNKTYSYSGSKVYTTKVDTYTIDGQCIVNGGKIYRFINATARIRNRDPYSTVYGGKTGYLIVGAGYGKKLYPGVSTELALGNVKTYGDDGENRISLVSIIRWKQPLSTALSFEGTAQFVQPFSPDAFVDSKMYMNYKLSPQLSLRLTYIANNLLKPLITRSGWDRSLGLSLVFNRTTN